MAGTGMIIASFVAFLTLFIGVGLASALKAKKTRTDYYLAGREVSPWLAGLSAVATNNSGYMFIGVIGFTYATGLAAIWLMVGWILGDYIASLFIHRRLREATARTKEASFAAVLAAWNNDGFAVWRRIAAILMVVFLGAYAAAQISAGGKALQGVLDWNPKTGAVASAVMILAYSAAGGIRASIWTDAAQSLVMLGAMSLLFVAGVTGLGGPQTALAQMGEIPGFLDWFPPDLILPGAAGVVFFVIGWMFAGLSVIGQPHIMVRFMALDKPDNMTRARAWYYGYFTLFYALATGVGMLSRLYLPDLGALDPELALPTMALELLPAIFVGMILAGIFAATMSTADSLVLSCSAAITHDLLPERVESSWALKTATAAVTLAALAFALDENRSVFSLVILAWSTLASAFGPLLAIYALKRRIGEASAVAAMIGGVATALAWRAAGLHEAVYEGMPGMLTGFAIAWTLSRPAAARATRRAATAPAVSAKR
ncbi:sodium/proline symporter [Amphiplicatus metriothermophilus]|uniref:Sodium/proline symporter n=1 Tax=Amphiplicatus metriothermophilus TaxID=1519374 RepID=A0A239PJS4_9PROT|nr:sodium/proline symporter [Amphiplicatus metriothermophilus]MBB5517831.1 SSS family solute:Na+ symporter/sodium/proline symporter [Amphiplicatus metriothermophilus]SNT67835.1 solute:Na+ symporter, SSS family/sodium/proline symporter [Amphiplicatus metriothermophilus]